MTIKRLDVTFRTSSIVSFYNVTFFQFHDGKVMITSENDDFKYDVRDILELNIRQIAKTEPSLDLPFDK